MGREAQQGPHKESDRHARSDAQKVETVSLLAKTRAAVAGAPLASASFSAPQERGAEQTTSLAALKKCSGSRYLAVVPDPTTQRLPYAYGKR